MRNPNPFTDQQIKFLEAIRDKIREINDPHKDYVSHESVTWYTEQLKGFGKIPKIRFKPNAQSIKAEIMRSAGLTDSISESRKQSRRAARKKQDYRQKSPKNDTQRLADLFDKMWNNIALKAKKATFTISYINRLFAMGLMPFSDPANLLQNIIADEYADYIKVEQDQQAVQEPEPTEESSYEKELLEVD